VRSAGPPVELARSPRQADSALGGQHSLKAWEKRLCPIRSRLRSEGDGRKSYRCWDSSASPCRWRAEPPPPVCRQPIHRLRRRGIPRWVTQSLSVRKKSPTSAWGRSTSSTRRTPEHPGSASRLPGAVEAVEAAAAEDADAVEPADAAVVAAEAAAAVRGGSAVADVRLKDFSTSLSKLGTSWRGLTRLTASRPVVLRNGDPAVRSGSVAIIVWRAC
jgi:hypothetical protein